jgi:hypothetical protein
VASLSLLVALLALPWVLAARRHGSPPVAARAWTPPAPRQPVQPWCDPDDWWRESSDLPSRAPRRPADRAASSLEV